MISVKEAREIIDANTEALLPVEYSLQLAGGKILAEDVYAEMDIPGFPQSSMDGYAFSFNGWKQNKKLLLEGEIAAGSSDELSLVPGKAVRIFTGAPVPPGADTVIMQEKVTIGFSADDKKEVRIEDEGIRLGINVRPKGSEIKKGELALEKGSLLSPAAIGFLAGIGISKVKVFPSPVISIIITGKELQQPGELLVYGQVYESNSYMLTAVLQHLHFDAITIFRVDDDLETVTRTLSEALEQSDMVLLTGGISAGDYDFVLPATVNCGVTKLFHKIKQRPGKPLYFGKKENKLVFGLPGNPSSVLTSFYEYVLRALAILTKQQISLPIQYVPLEAPFNKQVRLTQFLKGFYNGKTVSILEAQESYRLSSFAKANCLVKLEEEMEECKEGQIMEIHLLPA